MLTKSSTNWMKSCSEEIIITHLTDFFFLFRTELAGGFDPSQKLTLLSGRTILHLEGRLIYTFSCALKWDVSPYLQYLNIQLTMNRYDNLDF